MTGLAVIRGDDGVARCAWSGSDPEYQRYHDEEWGKELRGDRALFEKLTLEAFQSGLSWITILRRREGFRRAFEQFDWYRIAAFDDDDVQRLLLDEGIIRNRAKIIATIDNAQILRDWLTAEPGGLDAVIWSHRPAPRESRPRTLSEVAAQTDTSRALATALKQRGLRFIGPTTAYALMQSAGLVDDHVAECFRATES